jgi:hypothetical protein
MAFMTALTDDAPRLREAVHRGLACGEEQPTGLGVAPGIRQTTRADAQVRAFTSGQ